MAKINAYGLFVDDIVRKRQARGDRVNRAQLFRELDSEWRSLSESVKQQYKDRAKSGDTRSTSLDGADHNPSQDAAKQSHDMEAIEGSRTAYGLQTSINEERNSARVENSLVPRKEPKPKPSKRPQEIEQAQNEIDRGVVVKKFKPGLPKWRQHEDLASCEKARYPDYGFYQSRKQCETLIASRKDRLISLPIYSYSVNVLCQDQKGEFVPIEITIYAYSLKDGKLKDPYHVLIDPGEIPLGCISISQDHMKSHLISYPFEDDKPPSARKDYLQIYKEILEYTKAGERTLLISEPKQLDQARGSIEWLYKRAMEQGAPGLFKPTGWSVFSMIDFFATLDNFVRLEMLKQDRPKFALHYRMRVLLDQTLLDHNPDKMCHYHQPDEKQTKYCTRSIAIRSICYLESVIDDIYQLLEAAARPAIEGSEMLAITESGNEIEAVEMSLSLVPAIEPENEPEIFIEYPSDKPDETPVITIVTAEQRKQLKPTPKKKDLIFIGCNSEVNQDNPPDVY